MYRSYNEVYQVGSNRVSLYFQDGELESVKIKSGSAPAKYFEVWEGTREGWLRAARLWAAKGIHPQILN